MKARRWVTIGSGAAAILVLAIGAPGLGSWAREEYHLRRLASGDPAAQTEALEELVALRSLRALPLILDLLAAESDPLELPGRFAVWEQARTQPERSRQGRLRNAVYSLDLAAAPELIQRLRSTDAVERRLGAYFLGICGPRAAGLAPRLFALLQDPAESVREEAARAVGTLAIGSQEVEEKLSGLLLDPDSTLETRRICALAIRHAISEAAARKQLESAHVRRFLAAFVRASTDSCPEVRESAAASLEELLTTFWPSIPPAISAAIDDALIARLEDPSPSVRRYVLEGLRIDFLIRDEWLAPLRRSLGDPDSAVREAAEFQLNERELALDRQRMLQGALDWSSRQSR